MQITRSKFDKSCLNTCINVRKRLFDFLHLFSTGFKLKSIETQNEVRLATTLPQKQEIKIKLKK